MADSLATQIIQRTKAQILAAGLSVATGLGLNVTSWLAGDPTRTLFHYIAEILETWEEVAANFVRSGFLDYAEGFWLHVLAQQLFGVAFVEATFASCSVELVNAGGGLYTPAIGEVTVQDSTTGKTYTNSSAGTLNPLGSLTLTFTADEAGAASSAGVGDIDTMVTAMPGVTCSNTTAAVGVDEETDASLRDRCRAKLGTLSATGPRDAYDFVVRDPTLNGGETSITKSITEGESTTGDVTIVIASSTGAAGLSGTAVASAQSAVETWAAPLCITPSVIACFDLIVAVTYEIWIYSSVGETEANIKAKIAADLLTMFEARPIGGDKISSTGKLYHSLIEATIKASYPSHIFRVSVTLPAGDTSVGSAECVVLGTVTATAVNFVVDP